MSTIRNRIVIRPAKYDFSSVAIKLIESPTWIGLEKLFSSAKNAIATFSDAVLSPSAKYTRVKGEFAFITQAQVKLVVLQPRAFVPTVPLQDCMAIKHGWTHRSNVFLQQHAPRIAIAIVGPVMRAVYDAIALINDERMTVRKDSRRA